MLVTLGAARLVFVIPCPLRRTRNLLLLPFGFFVWHSRPRLWCLVFSFLFLIPRFSAVLDPGQELADALDVSLGPQVNNSLAHRDSLGSGGLAQSNVLGKRGMVYRKLLGCFTCREPLHSATIVDDRLKDCQGLFLVAALVFHGVFLFHSARGAEFEN